MELEQAIQQASNNDPLAFEELYRQYYSLVYRSIRSLVSDEDEALDLLQDTFLKVYQKIGQFKGDSSSFPAWIKRIAINTAKDFLIKKKPILFTEMENDGEGTEPVEERFVQESADGLPDLILDQKETSRLIREILDTLPEDQRLPVVLFYQEGMAQKEIAEILGVDKGLVNNRISQGRKKVEKQVLELEKRGTKLYGLAPLPFLLFLFRSADAQAATMQPDMEVYNALRNEITVRAAETSASGVQEVGMAGEASSLAGTVASKAVIGSGTKAIIAIVSASAVLLGGSQIIKHAVASPDTEQIVSSEEKSYEEKVFEEQDGLLQESLSASSFQNEEDDVSASDSPIERVTETDVLTEEILSDMVDSSQPETDEFTEAEDNIGPFSLSADCAEIYRGIMSRYMDKEIGFSSSGIDFEGYLGENKYGTNNPISASFALLDIDGSGNPELFVRGDYYDDTICSMYTINDYEYGIFLCGYDPGKDNLIENLGMGSRIYRLENDKLLLKEEYYMPFDGSDGSILFEDGSSKTIPASEILETEEYLFSWPLPNLEWIPLNNETVTEYFG